MNFSKNGHNNLKCRIYTKCENIMNLNVHNYFYVYL